MRLPEIRDRLHELADLHGIDELHELAEETRRRYNGRQAGPVSVPVTPELAQAVSAYATAFPTLPLGEIGRVFRLNQGRVSEILNGKRT
jgi:hypothetical protein